MARLLVILLLPVLAVWSPVGRCCVLQACDTAAESRTTHQAPAAPSGCAACEHGEAPPAEPASDTPATPEPDGCTCDRAAAPAPAEREAVISSTTHGQLLPALNLWVALPYAIDAEAVRRSAGFERDVGPPTSQPRSLLAQACLLTI